MTVDWGGLLVGQLAFYWDTHLWPRLSGLTDAEYFWEPVAGCPSVRRHADGHWVSDDAEPESESDPPPVTTIAWRIAHIGVGCFAIRTSTFFGDGSVPDDADMWDPRHEPTDLPGSAADALDFLDREYHRWHGAIAALDAGALAAPLGPKGSEYAEDPMASLIMHVNREVMHHGGEIGLMRDLYRVFAGTTVS